MFDRYIERLAIEVSRKCNLNCPFCSRGKSQPVDISKEVIDKTLDELSNTYIGILRVSGGEPFLAPEMIRYLIKQIIAQNISVCFVEIFTNGSILPSELYGELKELSDHISKTRVKPISEWFWNQHAQNYNGINDKNNIAIIISDIDHDLGREAVAKELLRQFQNERIAVVNQTDTYDIIESFILDGNAKENYKSLLGDTVEIKRVRTPYYKYNYMKMLPESMKSHFKKTDYIAHSLSISANGNVFPGYMMEYRKVDSEYLFNIIDCNGDFFDRVQAYCWSNPISPKMAKVCARYETIQFCQNHRITISDTNEEYIGILKWMILVIDYYRGVFKRAHNALPFLSFNGIEMVAMAKTVLTLFQNKIEQAWIITFLDECTDFGVFLFSTPEQCESVLQELGKYRELI